MTAAHTALFGQLFALLATAPHLVIHRGPTHPDELAQVDFGRWTITISDTADLAEFVESLAYGIRHLQRGPCYEGDEAEEERAVTEETAALLATTPGEPVI